MPSDCIPKLSRHKSRKLAYATLNGKERYLGLWPDNCKSAPMEVKKAYDDLIHRWLAHNRTLPEDHQESNPETISLNRLFFLYLQHLLSSVEDPKAPAVESIKSVIKMTRKVYGLELASNFGPKKLKHIRELMIKEDWCRNDINRQIARLKASSLGLLKKKSSQEGFITHYLRSEESRKELQE